MYSFVVFSSYNSSVSAARVCMAHLLATEHGFDVSCGAEPAADLSALFSVLCGEAPQLTLTRSAALDSRGVTVSLQSGARSTDIVVALKGPSSRCVRISVPPYALATARQCGARLGPLVEGAAKALQLREPAGTGAGA